MLTILHRAAQWPAPELHRVPSSDLCALPEPRERKAECFQKQHARSFKFLEFYITEDIT